MAKGIAILAMVILHLFCRLDNLPYTPLLYVAGKPLVYYLGLFGDMCVFIYCFCSGYAQFLLCENEKKKYFINIPRRLFGFLCNYWIVLILFAGIGLIFDRSGRIPGDFRDFLGNFLLYDLSYNGAWWFVLTYVFLSLLSPVFFQLTKKLNGLLLILLSGVMYFASYLFRFHFQMEFSSNLISWLWTQAVLLGTSQLGYLLGMIFRKYRWITGLRLRIVTANTSFRIRLKQGTLILIPLALFAVHCFEPSLIIAPITGLGTLVCFWLLKKPSWMQKLFLFFGKHSTNIWLTHMFFYSVLFTDLVFVFRYPVLILLVMLSITTVISVFIEKMYSQLVRLL